MFSIFKNLFNFSEHQNSNSEIKENKKEWVKISGNQIVCRGNWDIEYFAFDSIEYIYAVNNDYANGLFVSGKTSIYIDKKYTGFKEFYEIIAAKFNFDTAVYNKITTLKKQRKAQLWRKIEPQNYSFIENQNFTDYGFGFEIQNEKKDFISWDMKLEDLVKNTNFKSQTTSYGSKYAVAKHQVRIGNLLLGNFSFGCDQERKDVAVLNFYCHCYHKSNTVISYNEIKTKWLADFKNSQLIFERDDQLDYHFYEADMQFEIIYSPDSDYGFDNGNCYLYIENKREYTTLIENKAYEASMKIDAVLAFDSDSVSTSENYKQNDAIKRRPPLLDIETYGENVIWLDNENKKIGFANEHFSQVYAINKIAHFEILNVHPAKGGGYATLYIKLKNDQQVFVFDGDQNYFNGFVDDLKTKIGIKVIFLPETSNC